MESVCFTGTCRDMPRAELTQKASKKFEVRNSVTKDLDILVCENKNSGSSKLEKAKKNGTRIISYKEFFDMVDDIKDDGVFYIRNGVLKKCSDDNIENVDIPSGVMEIAEGVFADCTALTSIEIPATVTKIGKCAFDGCVNVQKIVSKSPLFPFSEKTGKLYDATGKSKKAILSLMAGKEEAKKKKITEIENVSASTVLESIMSEHKTNAEVIRDDKNAFLRIKTEDGGFEIVLADSKVSKWMPNLSAFLDFVATGADSIAIRKFAIERGLEDSSKKFISLSKDGSAKWKKKTKPIYLFIPEGVTQIGEEAFYVCDSLKFLVIPESVKKIERDAFYWCSSLENVVFPDGLEEIGECAFYDCKSLTKVVIPPSVKKIGASAFGSPFGDDNSIKDVTISNGVEIIGEGAFSNCHLLESLTIPGSVQNIECGAFSGCLELKTLEIEKGVGKIEEKAFEDCKTLSEITYTGTVAEWNKIEKGRKWHYNVPAQFVKCSDGEVSIVPKIEEIKTDTYTLGIYDNGVERCKCTDETDELVIPDGITIIEHGAFCECTGIKSIVFPSSLTKIERYAFAHCTALKSIELPSSLSIIDLEAFIGCTALESIEIPEGVKIINSAAFEDCTALKSVVFPSSLTGTGYKVFNHCSSLRDITFKGTMEQWKAVYFWGNEDMPAKVVHCADGDVEL